MATSSMDRTGQWILSQELPTDVTIQVGKNSFPLHKFMLVAKCGYIRKKMLDSNPTHLDISAIPGGEEAFERAVMFCYGVNFEINVYNVAALRCASDFLEMTEKVCSGNLVRRTEEFLEQVALRTLSTAVVVLASCDAVADVAADLGIVKRCVDVISFKACNEANFPTRASSSKQWLLEVSALPPPFLLKILLAMKTRGASPKTLSSIITTFAVNSLPDFLHPKNSSLPLSSPPAHIRAHQLSLLNSVLSLVKSTSASLPVSFLCHLLRAATFLKSTPEIQSHLEKLISQDLENATVADLLIIALDATGERVVGLDGVRRIVAGFVEREGGGVFGAGTVDVGSVSVQSVARVVDAFVAEIATDEELGVSKFAGVAAALPKSARRFDDDIYRAVDIFLKAHPGLDEIEKEKVCSVMDPLRLSYEARVHASQNKRLPLQVVLHALYYDNLKLRSNSGKDKNDESPATRVREQASADAALARENAALRSELNKMKMYMTDMERVTTKKVSGGGGRKTFLSSMSKKFGKLNPFGKGSSKDTMNVEDDDGEKVDLSKPRRRRFSIG